MGERDTGPCFSNTMALLDVGLAPTSKILLLVRGGGTGVGGCFKCSHPQLPPPGDGVDVLSPLSCRKQHFPPKTSVQVLGL